MLRGSCRGVREVRGLGWWPPTCCTFTGSFVSPSEAFRTAKENTRFRRKLGVQRSRRFAFHLLQLAPQRTFCGHASPDATQNGCLRRGQDGGLKRGPHVQVHVPGAEERGYQDSHKRACPHTGNSFSGLKFGPTCVGRGRPQQGKALSHLMHLPAIPTGVASHSLW